MSRQRGTTWQADVIKKDGRRLRPGGFKTEADANLWEAQATAADERGLPMPPLPGRAGSTLSLTGGMTMGELRKRVLADNTRDGWASSKAFSTADENSALVVKFFGKDATVASVATVPETDRFVAALYAVGNSGATVNRKLAALSKMLKWAVHKGLLAAVPYIARQVEGKRRERVIDATEESQILALFQVLGQDRFYRLTAFLIDTGARVSEALKLDPAKDVVKGAVTFRDTKNSSDRTIPLTARALAAVGTTGFRDIPYWEYRAAWVKMQTKLGAAYADVVIHTLRHTCATRLATDPTATTARLMRWMGHRNVATTMRYIHDQPGQFDGMLAGLDARSRTKSAVEHGRFNVTELVPKRA